MNARFLGYQEPARDIKSFLARLPGAQAHEHADEIVAGIGDSAAPSDQDRHRLMASPKSWRAPREASLPEAAPPEPSEDRQDKSSSNSAYARRVTLQEGDVEIYRGTESVTRPALERTPPRMGQAEP